MKRKRARPALRAHLDEEPLEGDLMSEEVERCWGYEMPVRHRARARRPELRP